MSGILVSVWTDQNNVQHAIRGEAFFGYNTEGTAKTRSVDGQVVCLMVPLSRVMNWYSDAFGAGLVWVEGEE